MLVGSSPRRKEEDVLGGPPSSAAAHGAGCGIIATSKTISCVLTASSGGGCPGPPPTNMSLLLGRTECSHNPGATPHSAFPAGRLQGHPKVTLALPSPPHPSSQLPYSLCNPSIRIHPQPWSGRCHLRDDHHGLPALVLLPRVATSPSRGAIG